MEKRYYYFAGVAVLIIIIVTLIGISEKKAAVDTDTASTTATSTITSTGTPGASVSSSKPGVTGTTSPDASVTIVTYTASGFSPKTVQVTVGHTVRFVNMSNRSLWVMSNTEPAAGYYHEFDQGTTVGRGGVYNFTFNKTGAFTYRNYDYPKDQGVIAVNPQ
jgi:plastocyanin